MEYHIKLVEKTAGGLTGLTSILVLPLGKMLLNSIALLKKSFVKRESVEMGNFTVVFF